LESLPAQQLLPQALLTPAEMPTLAQAKMLAREPGTLGQPRIAALVAWQSIVQMQAAAKPVAAI
jgi:hypothetical protein